MHRSSKAGLSTVRAQGESMTVSALTFLAADSGRLERFLSVTGLGPGNLRAAAAGAGFCSSVLGYIVGEEALLLRFAAESSLAPEDVVRALTALEATSRSGEP
jgi:Protein of unknown function (DUF3572)